MGGLHSILLWEVERWCLLWFPLEGCLEGKSSRKGCHFMWNAVSNCPIWNFLFISFGVKWVMPKAMNDLFKYWCWSSITFHNRVWNVSPSCLMSQLLRGSNKRTIEGHKLFIERFKSQFPGELFYWLSLDASRPSLLHDFIVTLYLYQFLRKHGYTICILH